MAQISVPIKIDGIDFVIGVMKRLVDEFDFKEGVSDDYKNVFYDFSNAVITTFENFKDDDVKLVRHAKWELIDECVNEGVYCSNCHKKIYRTEYANQKVKSKYCPNCGARMDGEEE